MERLVQRLCAGLAGHARLQLVGPLGCADHAPPGCRVAAVPLRPLPLFLLRALVAGLRLARRQRPDLVLCGSGLMAPLGRLIGRLLGVPVVCLLHGLDVVADHPVYRAVFLPAIRRCDRLIANSSHTAALARAAGVPAAAITVIHPGAEPAVPADPDHGARFRLRHALTGPVILVVGRLTRRKGLPELVQHALPRVLAARPDAVLVVVGDEARHALGRAATPLLPALRQQIAAAGLEAQVRLLGDLPDSELAAAFACAAVLAFPVLDLPGDVEGFGMVAVEAAAHGVPTVAFRVGGVPDAIAPGRSGLLLAPGDYEGFAEALLQLIDGQVAGIDAASCRAFAAGFDWPSRARALFEACAGLLGPERRR